MKTKANETIHPEIKTEAAYDSQSIYHDVEIYSDTHSSGGLTKREYFAAMAMQGILAANRFTYTDVNRTVGISTDAIAYADALIEALNQ